MRSAGTLAFTLLVGLAASGCAQTSYAEFVRFADVDQKTDPLEGCGRAFTSPNQLELRCPSARIVVDDRLRDTPYGVLRRWPAAEAERQRGSLAATDGGNMQITVEEMALPDGSPWPVLHAISLAGPDGLTPVEDVRLVKAPFDRDGVRELRCSATGPLGVERCDAALAQLVRLTPVAQLPTTETLFESCAEERFPLQSVRAASVKTCRDLRLVTHAGAASLPAPETLVRAFGLNTGTTTAEVAELPPLDDDVRIEARAFTFLVDGRVVWAGVLAREPATERFAHCGMQLPPALAHRHCYRAVVLELTGDDQLGAR